jgi:hypothetical protein
MVLGVGRFEYSGLLFNFFRDIEINKGKGRFKELSGLE